METVYVVIGILDDQVYCVFANKTDAKNYVENMFQDEYWELYIKEFKVQ